jgi:hypothetical protein
MCQEDCLHWDVNELDKVPDESHDREPDSNRSAELNVFYDKGIEGVRSKEALEANIALTLLCGLGAPVDELSRKTCSVIALVEHCQGDHLLAYPP